MKKSMLVLVLFSVITYLVQAAYAEYNGDIKNGLRDGYGTLIYEGGDKYVGNFKKNLFNGKGIFYFTGGSKYEGGFKNGLFDGYRVFTYSDGSKYEGEFKNDLYNGNGTFTDEDGNVTKGIFQDGECINGNINTVESIRDRKSYIFEDSDTRVLSYLELSSLSDEELEFARNEIYARHGHVFKKKKFKNYFASKSWYIEEPDYKDTLNKIEQKNVELIKKIENSNK